MELKKEDNINNEYATKEDEATKTAKPKKSLKKWGIVGATVVVAGLVATGICIQVYNQIQGGLTYEPPINYIQISAYNSIYTNYVGANKSASDVKSLLARIYAHNNNIDERINYGSISAIFDETGDITEFPNPIIKNDQAITTSKEVNVYSGGTVRDSKYYYIAITGYNSLGAVSEVTIWQQNSYFQTN